MIELTVAQQAALAELASQTQTAKAAHQGFLLGIEAAQRAIVRSIISEHNLPLGNYQLSADGKSLQLLNGEEKTAADRGASS